MTPLRRIRDELLVTTPAGREWIALYERVQTSLLEPVLADQSLTAPAATLLRAASKALTDDEAVLDRDTSIQVLGFLRNLHEHAPFADTRVDLRSVGAVVEKSRGRRAAQLLQTLMAHGPDT